MNSSSCGLRSSTFLSSTCNAAKFRALSHRNTVRIGNARSFTTYCSSRNDQSSDHIPTSISYTPEVAEIAAAASTSTPNTPNKVRLPQQKQPTEEVESFESFIASLKDKGKRLYDRVYYGDVFPPTGSFQLSYARLLELLAKRRVKRLVLLSDGRTAIAEIPVENTESNFETQAFDRRDPTVQYAEEVAEWKMEKNRYYVELPGDVWEEGTLMELIKRNQERRVWMNGQLRIPYDNLLRLNQVRPELQVVDPGDAYVWLNEYSTQFLPIMGLLVLRLFVGAGDLILRKMGKEKKSAEEQIAEKIGAHRAMAFNVEEEEEVLVGKGNKKTKRKTKRDTGVRYDDVAGIDAVKDDIRVILDILLGDEKYKEMGAHPIRGILLEGPPGTGKTLLAKAMAGEAGVPFFSANGAEFVEMFQGVAAARIRSLFRAARKNAPAIIFIDEIDAIGKARDDSTPSDSGTAEREQGLLQLLTEMDGFHRDDKILIIGATNLASKLDEALLRPGRFDRTIHMGLPSPSNRLKILQVHAKNKPIDRSNDDALLSQIADLAIGYSGAELANLLNEAAILAVRKDSPMIDLSILKEAMEKVKLGLPHTSLPDSLAKRRFALVEAARAVAFALTPGLPKMEHVTIRPRGGAQARILFVPQEPRRDGGSWHQLVAPGTTTNAVTIDEPLTSYELCTKLITPLYVPRCCEEIVLGEGGASLLTSKAIGTAGRIARWIVVDSKLYPGSRDSPMLNNMKMGKKEDPTTAWKDGQYDEEISTLLRGAYHRARALVYERREVIEIVAKELCENADETVLGSRIVELLKTTPLGDVPVEEAEYLQKERESRMTVAREELKGVLSRGDALADEEVKQVVEVVIGKIEDWDLVPGSVIKEKAAQVRKQLLDPKERKRLEQVAVFGSGDGLNSFPAAPEVPENKGRNLSDWLPPSDTTIVL